MEGERDHVPSRKKVLADKFDDKRYRDSYVAANTRGVLAQQMRNFRGDLSQADFGVEVGKRQTVISRLESPTYGGWSVRTMLEIARKRNVAVFCRFVDFRTFLKLTDDLSDAALYPTSYDDDVAEHVNAPPSETNIAAAADAEAATKGTVQHLHDASQVMLHRILNQPINQDNKLEEGRPNNRLEERRQNTRIEPALPPLEEVA